MAQLAIKGHATRGSEVIELLEMLGGINSRNLYGDENYAYYTIDADNEIIGTLPTDKFVFYALERFIGKYPYKVGDKVLYKHENTTYFIRKMYWEKDKVLYQLSDEVYSDGCSVPDSLIFDVDAEKLQPYKKETMQEKKINQMSLANCDLDEVEIFLGDKFELRIKEGKYYAVRKQSRYPKSCEECLNVLGKTMRSLDNMNGYKFGALMLFQQLLICRDAYWKIAGEQMGFGKPWIYDISKEEFSYSISYSYGDIQKNEIRYKNAILVFPFKEMRDAFYENFKDLIEECKMLL